MSDFSNQSNLLKTIAERAQLREGAQGVESVLRAVFRAQHDLASEPLTGRALARIVRLPVPVITAIRRELEKEGVVEPGPHIRLTRAADATIGGEWGWASADTGGDSQVACAACGGTGVAPSGPQWEAVLADLRRHFEDNPRVDVTLDQSHCTPETNLRRVAYMHGQGALAGKDVLVLGDDGSVSAAPALAGEGPSPTRRLSPRGVALVHLDRKPTHLAGNA